MKRTTDLLMAIRKTMKLYESMLKTVCEKYQLTQIEATIISFLQNNQERETAGDIAELKMLSKGNVSQAVEALIQKALLQRRQDTADRRRIHLSLTENAEPIMQDIETLRQQFEKKVFYGFSKEERELFASFNDRIMENSKRTEDRGENE